MEVNAGHIGAYGINTEPLAIEFFFDLKKSGGIFLIFCGFTIAKSQFKGKEFDFWFFDILGELLTWALCINASFRAQIVLGYVVEAVENAISDFANDIVDFNM